MITPVAMVGIALLVLTGSAIALRHHRASSGGRQRTLRWVKAGAVLSAALIAGVLVTAGVLWFNWGRVLGDIAPSAADLAPPAIGALNLCLALGLVAFVMRRHRVDPDGMASIEHAWALLFSVAAMGYVALLSVWIPSALIGLVRP